MQIECVYEYVNMYLRMDLHWNACLGEGKYTYHPYYMGQQVLLLMVVYDIGVVGFVVVTIVVMLFRFPYYV